MPWRARDFSRYADLMISLIREISRVWGFKSPLGHFFELLSLTSVRKLILRETVRLCRRIICRPGYAGIPVFRRDR